MEIIRVNRVDGVVNTVNDQDRRVDEGLEEFFERKMENDGTRQQAARYSAKENYDMTVRAARAETLIDKTSS